MSRIGKKPVMVPPGVEVQIEGQQITAKGPLGERGLRLPPEVLIERDGDRSIQIKPRQTSKRSFQMWGLSRSLVQNLITGLHTGYTKVLEINGVGYRAAVQNEILILNLGYSHPVRYPIPQGVTVKTEKPTMISIHGADKQQIGQIAAILRAFRKPEPYKGKGIKYLEEVIPRKEGKKK